jgi:hypothetical protein
VTTPAEVVRGSSLSANDAAMAQIFHVIFEDNEPRLEGRGENPRTSDKCMYWQRLMDTTPNAEGISTLSERI